MSSSPAAATSWIMDSGWVPAFLSSRFTGATAAAANAPQHPSASGAGGEVAEGGGGGGGGGAGLGAARGGAAGAGAGAGGASPSAQAGAGGAAGKEPAAAAAAGGPQLATLQAEVEAMKQVRGGDARSGRGFLVCLGHGTGEQFTQGRMLRIATCDRDTVKSFVVAACLNPFLKPLMAGSRWWQVGAERRTRCCNSSPHLLQL